MKHRNVIVALVALFVAAAAVPAVEGQAAEHPILGVWSLDTDASSYSPGTGPMGQRRRFWTDDEGFVYVNRITVAPNGTPNFAITRMKFDGRDYPVWSMAAITTFMADGPRPSGTASFEMVGERTLRLTQRNADGEVGPLGPNMWEVSADGRTLTVTTSGTNADGVQVNNVEIYRRVEG